MSKKGISTSLVVVVTAVVLLVVALVLLTIFGGIIPLYASIAEAKNLCITTYLSSCQSLGQSPTDWEIATKWVRDQNGDVNKMSCKELASGCSCDYQTHKVTGC
jgi:hypothetical protein